MVQPVAQRRPGEHPGSGRLRTATSRPRRPDRGRDCGIGRLIIRLHASRRRRWQSSSVPPGIRPNREMEDRDRRAHRTGSTRSICGALDSLGTGMIDSSIPGRPATRCSRNGRAWGTSPISRATASGARGSRHVDGSEPSIRQAGSPQRGTSRRATSAGS
jgi:hypothetical protein